MSPSQLRRAIRSRALIASLSVAACTRSHARLSDLGSNILQSTGDCGAKDIPADSALVAIEIALVPRVTRSAEIVFRDVSDSVVFRGTYRLAGAPMNFMLPADRYKLSVSQRAYKPFAQSVLLHGGCRNGIRVTLLDSLSKFTTLPRYY